MAFSSETQLCNNALLRLGANTISSLTDGSVEANVCNQVYAITRDSLLRSHYWNFAVVRDTLAEDVTPPDFGWNNQYTIPSDYIRLLGFNNTSSAHKIEGTKLLIDHADELEIIYISKVTDVTQFDQLFSESLVLMMAIKIAKRVGGVGYSTQELQAELNIRLAEAKMIDAQESSPDQITFDTFSNSRQGISNWFETSNGDM